MCGCAGTYSYNKINQKWSGENRGYEVTDNEVNEKRIKRVVNKVRKNQNLGIENIDDYIYTVVVGNTQYSIYLVK
jgi:hypothetical protein